MEPGEDVLVLHSGYFGDSFKEWCAPLFAGLYTAHVNLSIETYGGKVDQVHAEISAAVSQQDIETALKAKKYKAVTFTHVDTSTGVLSDARAISETVRRVSPDTLVSSCHVCTTRKLTPLQIICDGVCSVASEEIKFDQWDLDIVLTASQKGLGTPPGLSIVVASKRAINVRQVALRRVFIST